MGNQEFIDIGVWGGATGNKEAEFSSKSRW